jgi:ABC-type amino acid transport system permease subunit
MLNNVVGLVLAILRTVVSTVLSTVLTIVVALHCGTPPCEWTNGQLSVQAQYKHSMDER